MNPTSFDACPECDIRDDHRTTQRRTVGDDAHGMSRRKLNLYTNVGFLQVDERTVRQSLPDLFLALGGKFGASPSHGEHIEHELIDCATS